MIWPAVLPGAALRVMRAAVGRRAVHVALLVGGLVVLGVLCGERAQAADAAPPLGDTGGRVTGAQVMGAQVRVGRAGGEGTPATRGEDSDAVLPGVRPVTGDVTRSTTDRVVRPVGVTVEKVAGEVRATAQDTVSTLSSAPSASASGSPSAPVPAPVPTLPSLSLPPFSVLPDPSGAGDASEAPDRQAATGLPERPVPDRPGLDGAATVTATDDAGASGGTPDAPGTEAPGAAGASDRAAYGPTSGAGGAVPPAARAGTGRAGPAAAEAAETRGSRGAPDGALGAASSADHGGPRHGDAHAVTPYHRNPLRIVAAVLVRADEDGTRDPHQDIPVSPP